MMASLTSAFLLQRLQCAQEGDATAATNKQQPKNDNAKHTPEHKNKTRKKPRKKTYTLQRHHNEVQTLPQCCVKTRARAHTTHSGAKCTETPEEIQRRRQCGGGWGHSTHPRTAAFRRTGETPQNHPQHRKKAAKTDAETPGNGAGRRKEVPNLAVAGGVTGQTGASSPRAAATGRGGAICRFHRLSTVGYFMKHPKTGPRDAGMGPQGAERPRTRRPKQGRGSGRLEAFFGCFSARNRGNDRNGDVASGRRKHRPKKWSGNAPNGVRKRRRGRVGRKATRRGGHCGDFGI